MIYLNRVAQPHGGCRYLHNGYATSPCTPTPFDVDLIIDDIQFTNS